MGTITHFWLKFKIYLKKIPVMTNNTLMQTIGFVLLFLQANQSYCILWFLIHTSIHLKKAVHSMLSSWKGDLTNFIIIWIKSDFHVFFIIIVSELHHILSYWFFIYLVFHLIRFLILFHSSSNFFTILFTKFFKLLYCHQQELASNIYFNCFFQCTNLFYKRFTLSTIMYLRNIIGLFLYEFFFYLVFIWIKISYLSTNQKSSMEDFL